MGWHFNQSKWLLVPQAVSVDSWEHQVYWSNSQLCNQQALGNGQLDMMTSAHHDEVIKWKHFPRYWPFVQGIHRFPVNSTHKGLWRGALMFSLICVWINGWVNNREAGDLRCYRAHYDVIVMWNWCPASLSICERQSLGNWWIPLTKQGIF